MKKIICLALSLLMLMSLFSVGAFAEEELSEDISFEQTNNKETEHFKLTAKRNDSDGWYGGDDDEILTITSKDDNVIISRIEANIGAFGYCYCGVGVSGTAKKRENTAKNGDTVHVDGINSNTFSFSGGSDYVQFKEITVYYTNHVHSYGEDNVCTVCGKTRCEIEGHHSYKDGFCTICEHKCENEFHNGVYECEECHMTVTRTAGNQILQGSTISEGNMTILRTIAALGLGLVGGFILGKKRKPELANTDKK